MVAHGPARAGVVTLAVLFYGASMIWLGSGPAFNIAAAGVFLVALSLAAAAVARKRGKGWYARSMKLLAIAGSVSSIALAVMVAALDAARVR